MREIKFRYWNAEDKIMIDGDSFAFEEYLPISQLLSREGTMQYTGLKDEAGVEIYEHDYLYAPGNLTDELHPVGLVVWDETDARWEVVTLHGRFEYIPSGCYVKGNKYQSSILEVAP